MTARLVVTMSIALVLTAARVSAQEVRIERASERSIAVVGGGPQAPWRLYYGVSLTPAPVTMVLSPSPDRAYFVHNSWLRLIDTTSGVVIGRWRFPYTIEAVTPNGGAVDVRFKMPPWSGTANLTVSFDPAIGKAPDFDVGALITYRTAESEAWELLRALAPGPDPWRNPIRDAARHVALFDDMAKRDPAAIMIHLARAKLLRDAGDPRAAAAFESLSRVPFNDYTEGFRAAALLAELAEPEASRIAFERAFRDFIRRDRDPRLVDTLIARMILYLPGANLSDRGDAVRQAYLDRAYLLGPTSETTDRAWAYHAGRLEAKGDTAAAALWRERAETSARESLFLATLAVQLRHGRYQMLALGSLLAAILFTLSRHAKYAAQRRMHAAAALRNQEPLLAPWLGLQYWSRRDRWSLFALALAGWLAMGHSWTFARVMFRSASLPVHVGTIDGHLDFTTVYPASPERDLLYALALQYSGKLDDAERLYRSLPQFAESWNNLGVMQARTGRLDESRQAFARALAIDAALPEAVLNSTGDARTLATQTFQKYAPDGKMIAVPAREIWLRGYLGPVWTGRYWRAVLGPLDAFRFARTGGASYLNTALLGPTIVGGGALGAFLVLAIVLLAFVRYQDVTVAPGRVAEWLTWLLPGTAPAWRWAGPVVLVMFCAALLAAIFQVRVSSPYFLMAVAQAGVLRAFGYDSAYFDLNPPMSLLLGVLIVVWSGNAAVIWLSKRAQTDGS